jgi:hypothetical protein
MKKACKKILVARSRCSLGIVGRRKRGDLLPEREYGERMLFIAWIVSGEGV